MASSRATPAHPTKEAAAWKTRWWATRKQIDEGDRGGPNARLVLWTFLDRQRQGHISPSPSPDHTHIHPDLQNMELCGVGGGKTGIATTLAAVS